MSKTNDPLEAVSYEKQLAWVEEQLNAWWLPQNPQTFAYRVLLSIAQSIKKARDSQS
jgi:hypothetical protein